MNIIFNNTKLFISAVFWVFLIIAWHIYSGFMPSYQLPSPMMVTTAMVNIVLDIENAINTIIKNNSIVITC